MKWSSPLPRLKTYFSHDPLGWVWGFHLCSVRPLCRDIVLEVYLAPWTLRIYLTWPERSTP